MSGVFTSDLVSDAVPTPHFDLPPYTAVLYNEASGWAGVENRNGFNALSFKSKPGAKFAPLAAAREIADQWNRA